GRVLRAEAGPHPPADLRRRPLDRNPSTWHAALMRKPTAAVGPAVFFVVAPGTVIALIPWWLTGWPSRPAPEGWSALFLPLRALGLVMTVAGAAFVITAFVRFVVEGLARPAPSHPR